MVDVRITEEAHDIRFQLAAIRAGKEVRVPVPGLSVGVPSGPNAGVQLRVFLNGSPSSLQTLVCLGACAQVGFFWLCGSQLTAELPICLLEGRYDFSDFCEETQNITAAGSSKNASIAAETLLLP